MISNESRYQRSDGSIRRYYYYNCLNSKSNNGHECNFKTKYDADLLEEFVIDSIQTSLKNNVFIDSLRKQIGVKTNSDSIKMELEVSKKKLSEIRNSKSRIERDIDSLCSDDKYFERKMNDLKRRLNNQYDLLYEAEDEVERLSAQLEEVESKNVDEKYICKLLDNFKALYENFTANEKTLFMKSIIKRIELNKLGESISPVKSIEFQFPIFKDYSLLNDSNKFLSHLKEKDYFSKIEFGVDVDNKSEYLNYFSYDKKTNTFIDNRKITKGEYELVRDYVKTKYHKSPNSGMIAYVKRSLGFEMRDNYNHSKKGKGNRIPSKEMQQYIKDALIELGYYKC